MSDTIVGMMWNRNEADILAQTIADAAGKVDTLFIADDGSTDRSWDIITAAKGWFDNIEHIQQKPNPSDKGQRQSLLNEIRRRYKPQDAWVQVIESDIMLTDFTNVKEKVQTHVVGDVAMYWVAWNMIRDPGTWYDVDTYPHWDIPLRELLPYAHRMENMLYTFRPLPDLNYRGGPWRPWPKGFAKYLKNVTKADKYRPLPPVLLHYGHRGPTHFYEKYKNMGATHRRYKSWKLGSIKEVELTVPYFNGDWNGKGFVPTREGFRGRADKRLPKLEESRYS
jgi:glycosyltransferase involved in cell wall biosynthesis